MSKVVMMYRTALLAQDKGIYDVVNKFNSGEHFIDENNDNNSYSVLKD